MPRMRNEVTGAVMTVPDSTAALLGSEWVPSEMKQSEPEGKRERPRRSRKSNSSE